MNPVSATVRRGREPAVLFVVVTALLDVIGFGLIIPVLPLLVGEMTSGPDSQAHWYGFLAATFGFMQVLCSPFLGALSDRFGRRPVLLVGIFGLGVNFLLTGLATSLSTLFIARAIGGAMSANIAVANAYIADITPPDERAQRFGMMGAAFGIGFIIGPMVGGLLGQYGARLPFFAAAGLSVLNWLYGLLVLPESLPRERRTPVSFAKSNPLSSIRKLARLKGVGLLVAVIALTSMAQFILHSTWVLYTAFRFGWGPREVGISLFAVGVVATVVQGGLLRRLLKRFGPRRLALVGLASGICGYAGYGLAMHSWIVYFVIVCNSLAVCVNPSLQSFVSRAADAGEQGATMGALSALNSIMMVIAPIAGASVFAAVSHLARDDWRVGAPFFLSSTLMMIALALALRHFARRPHREIVADG